MRKRIVAANPRVYLLITSMSIASVSVSATGELRPVNANPKRGDPL